MDWVKIFRALGHEVRYALFLQLLTGAAGESCCEAVAPEEKACCVVDLTRVLPLAQSTISHHLHILVESGLVRQERRGTYSVYAVDPSTLGALGEYLSGLRVCEGPGSTHPVGVQPEV